MRQISGMTLREKVGQLFMLRPDALERRFSPDELDNLGIEGTTAVNDEMRRTYKDYPCGGFTLFQKNLLQPDQLRKLTEDLHSLGDPEPMIGIDEEGGRVAKIGCSWADFGIREIPPMGEIGATGDAHNAYAIGKEIGTYLTDFGLDIDFAPVADLNTNPMNPIIGDRAFGADPAAAGEMVSEEIRGLHEAGIASCIKHFPGHGDTTGDTHEDYAESRKTWEEMRTCEMVPFRSGIAAGTDLIMIAHISAPAVTGSREPSTMSRTMITERLRGELGYGGLIVTDALAMGAIRKRFTSSEACIACIEAGADILLMPWDCFEAFDGVVRAVEAGRLPQERIEQSLERILRFKQRLAEMRDRKG